MSRKIRSFAVVAAVGGLATVALTNNFASALTAGTSSTAAAPTSVGPTTSGPSSSTPNPSAPSSSGPTTSGPTTTDPTSTDPTTSGPTTSGPTTSEPTPSSSAPPSSGPTTTQAGPTTSGTLTISAGGVASVKTLSTSLAQDAATAAYEACTDKKLNVTVAVLGRDGVLIALVRNEAASPATVDVATGKAYASVSFKAPSGDLGELAKTNPGIVQVPKFVVLRGALPISVDKEVIGSIGVSGAPTGEQDEVCAKAGIEAISKK
jgi:uncharacterized protein GlcG (DUF336 family)